MLHSQLKRPTISTLFQRPSEGVGKCDFRVTAGGGKKMMAIQTTNLATGEARPRRTVESLAGSDHDDSVTVIMYGHPQ
jgi:hypothetical protein